MIIGFEAKRIFNNRSGLGNFGRNLVRALASSFPENQYLLFNSHPGKIEFGDSFSQVEEVRPKLSAPIYRDVWRQNLMTQDVKKRGVQIFHGLSMELPKGIGASKIASVLSVHDLIFIRHPELYKRIDRNIYTRKLQRSINEASLVVATSNQTREDLINLMKMPPKRIKVHYQGVHPSFWQKHAKSLIEEALSRFKLPKRFALFVGTLEERKGVRRMLQAQVKEGIEMVYIGRKTPYWKRLVEESKFKPIRDIIHTPEVDDTEDLSKIYQAAEFFVYPSIFEGFGIPVVEALASDIPVITSNISSLPEVAGPGSLLIDPENTEELTQAMKSLWDSEELRAQCVANSHTFKDQFRDKNLVTEWDNTYRSLLP